MRELIPTACGVGLRRTHFDELGDHLDQLELVEVVVENALGFSGQAGRVIDTVCAHVPTVLHGLTLSIGGPDPIDFAYVEQLAGLCDRLGAAWTTDHLVSSSGFGVQYHELVPLPFTAETIDHVASRVTQVKPRLPVPFGLENPSYYLNLPGEMDEATFLCELLEAADCGLLLDVNNVYVNSQNHGYDPRELIAALPAERVLQFHMAGHERRDGLIIDTHAAALIDPVLDLYRYALEVIGPRPTILEWDSAIPPLSDLLMENQRIRDVMACQG